MIVTVACLFDDPPSADQKWPGNNMATKYVQKLWTSIESIKKLFRIECDFQSKEFIRKEKVNFIMHSASYIMRKFYFLFINSNNFTVIVHLLITHLPPISFLKIIA